MPVYGPNIAALSSSFMPKTADADPAASTILCATLGSYPNTSVHPEYKGKGIGSLLIKALRAKALEQNCEYISCSTAVDAVSAVKVHLKNGYQIVGLKSFKSTNYYSYLFRMQLKPSQWSDPSYCKRQYKNCTKFTSFMHKRNHPGSVICTMSFCYRGHKST